MLSTSPPRGVVAPSPVTTTSVAVNLSVSNLQDVALPEQGECPADAGAEDDRYPLGSQTRVGRARVPPGLPGGDHGDLLAAVETAGAHPVELAGRGLAEPGDELGR